ncbi:MAG: outer membrane lipoprotein carrier protein LolA [Polyangiaceae bacterium]
MRSLPSLLAGLAVLAVAASGLADEPSPPASGAAPAASAAPAAAMPPSVDDAVARVQRFYDTTSTFQSDFKQEFVVKAYNTKKTSSGTVTFAKPGKMDWVYTFPKDNRVVSDGAALKVYDAGNKQLFEQRVDKSQYPAALAFLTGEGKLADYFTFELHPGTSMNFPGGYVLLGTPKQAHPAYTKVLFYVDAGTSQVLRVMIIDGQGNRNRFDFTAPKVNLAVQPTRFTFTPPQGTTIVRP